MLPVRTDKPEGTRRDVGGSLVQPSRRGRRILWFVCATAASIGLVVAPAIYTDMDLYHTDMGKIVSGIAHLMIYACLITGSFASVGIPRFTDAAGRTMRIRLALLGLIVLSLLVLSWVTTEG